MLNTNKVIAASLAVAAVSGASIALVSAASGSPAGGPHVTALTTGTAATPPAAVTNALRSSDAADRGTDPANARAISTSAGTWYLAPTNDGAGRRGYDDDLRLHEQHQRRLARVY
jgi:uncharacterized protein YraI